MYMYISQVKYIYIYILHNLYCLCSLISTFPLLRTSEDISGRSRFLEVVGHSLCHLDDRARHLFDKCLCNKSINRKHIECNQKCAYYKIICGICIRNIDQDTSVLQGGYPPSPSCTAQPEESALSLLSPKWRESGMVREEVRSREEARSIEREK